MTDLSTQIATLRALRAAVIDPNQLATHCKLRSATATTLLTRSFELHILGRSTGGIHNALTEVFADFDHIRRAFLKQNYASAVHSELSDD